MMKRILLATLFLFFGLGTLCAQDFFSTDKTAFFDELTAYLNTSTSKTDRDEAAAMMQSFGEVWNTRYSGRDVEAVVRMCNQFHAHGGNKAYFDIFTLTEILNKIPLTGMQQADVHNWISYSDQKSQKSLNGFDKYLSACRAVFVEKTLSGKGNSKWTIRDAKLGFPSDNECRVSITGDLVLASQKDESVIHSTSGSYYLENNIWKGSGGRVDWARFDIPAEQVYCELPLHYELDLTRSEYAIDSVVFHDKHYFEESILSRFEDKVLVNAPNERTMFPRVKSYRSDYYIRDILKDVDFFGGLGMMGNQVDVFGGLDKKAIFTFHRHKKEFLRVQAQRFMLSNEEILASDHVAMRLFMRDTIAGEVDSLYHNGLGFRFDNHKRSAIFFRSDKGYGDGPFHDHYHGFDIYLEAMYCSLDNNTVTFRRMEGLNPKSEGDVVSVNYFRADEFNLLRGLDGRHPMVRIEKFLQDYNNPDSPNLFYAGDLATYLQFPIEQVISMLLRLQAEGYVEYFSDEKQVLVLPRFFDVLESSRDNIDFDVIKLHTVTNNEPNIRLDLNTNDMLVFGITSTIDGIDGSAISLSDRKYVVIVPDNGRVVLTKDRDFRFSGGIIAGMFEFFTKDCLFTYDDFMIEMNKVDSLRLYARDDRHIIPVSGTIEKLKGRLMIDRGNNKSSRDETPEYPIFYSDDNAYKFYRNINSGVFNPGNVDSLATADDLADKFYFSVYPFRVDSLNDLSMRKVRFDGELVSAGIFPTFEEPLVVMEDYSLGFSHQIGNGDSDTYPMYNDLGRFHNMIHLSETGFWGNGQLDYQTSLFNSDQFMFYLDSVTGITNRFAMTPLADGTLFPNASAEALRLKWDVYTPALTTETIDNPICMYDGTKFFGKTTLTPEGYSADGKMRFGNTEFDSENFALDSRTFVADSANFLLFSSDSTTVAFAATNYRADVNFDNQKVQYEYLDANSNLDFPMNQFVCSLHEAEWDMTTNMLRVYNPEETFGDYATATTHEELLAIHNDASKFISLVPEHDSLQFYSMSAEYDMTNYLIHAHDVKIIRVADAAVFPYEHDVTIDSASHLQPFVGELLADTLNMNHLFKDAEVTIRSRNDYQAHGYWDFVAADGSRTPVFFDNIAPVDGISNAHAHLSDSVGFEISPQFGFRGNVTLKSTEPRGYFDGQFALLQFETSNNFQTVETDSVAMQPIVDSLDYEMLAQGEMLDSLKIIPAEVQMPIDTLLALNHWFVSSAFIDPEAIAIPVNMDTIRKKDPDLCNGLYYELAIDGGYFASFLTPKANRNDTDEVGPMDGMLRYEATSNRFVVTDTTNFNTFLTLNERGVIEGHATLDLGYDLALADFVVRGDYTQYPNDSLVLQGLNIFNAPIMDDKVLKGMAEVYASMDGESIDLTKTNYLDYFRSENDAVTTIERERSIELEGYPQMESKDFYNKTIVIPDLKMVWNDDLHAFVSVGKIGIGNFGKHVVNKYVDGYVVFDRRLGNITYLFMNDMFMTYINYNCGDGQMQIHATYGEINQLLYDKKEKSRTLKKNDKVFEYVATPYEALIDFLNRLRYAGIE